LAFKAAGNPCSVFREHITLNPGSFATGSGVNTSSASDDFKYCANIDYTPARIQQTNTIVISAGGIQTTGTFDDRHLHDSTAYSTVPTTDSWQVQLSGSGSPANTNGSNRGGQLT
jgi:hypothetical protein